jgi:hypothetical protein
MKEIFGRFTLIVILASSLVFPVVPGASASNNSLVVGSLRTVDGVPIPRMGISFAEINGNTLGSSTFLQTDKNGRFVAQIPTGSYVVYVRPGPRFDSKCLNTSFRYEVNQIKQDLNIISPAMETYVFTFIGSDPTKIVASVTPYLTNIQYESVESPGLGILDFRCERASFNSQAKPTWEAFKISGIQKIEEFGGGRYSYQGATGQRIDAKLPDDWWLNRQIRVELPRLPSIEIRKKSLKFANGFIYGTAIFSELQELSEFELTRKFNVRYRSTVKGKLRPWRSFSSRFTIDKKGQFKFRDSAGFRGRTNLEIVLVGNDFAVQSNLVQIAIQKR